MKFVALALIFLGLSFAYCFGAGVSEIPSDPWGKLSPEKAQFFKTTDVSDGTVKLTRKWYEVAAKSWGNYGPTEFWLVGKSAEAAEELNRKYCEVRKEKDPQLGLKDCLRRDYSFEDYVRDGGAGLNTRRGEHSDWSGFIITMSAKYPGPEEEDYRVVVLHEYFHVYQHAHIFSRKESERNSRNQVNPWWAEGGAEYMAQLLYSRQKGVRPGYLKEKMRQKLRSLKDLKKGESITEIPYGERAMIAYDLGTWFIAYLIDRTSEEAYLKGFYRDLNREGFEGSFQKNFGLSSDAMLEAFHQTFLPLSEEEKLKILP